MAIIAYLDSENEQFHGEIYYRPQSKLPKSLSNKFDLLKSKRSDLNKKNLFFPTLQLSDSTTQIAGQGLPK